MVATRVVLLADTHGFLDPRVAEWVASGDIAVHAGDVGGADVLLSLQPRDKLIAIRGNNDTPEAWSSAEQSVLQTLPREAVVDLPGGELVVRHGDDGGSIQQRHRRYRQHHSDAAAVVYGHSHRLTVDQATTPWLLNPGAAGRTRTYGGPSCLILDCDAAQWSVSEQRFERRRYPNVRCHSSPDRSSMERDEDWAWR